MRNPNGKNFTAPERTFVRNRGCYSCRHFDNDELARNRWRECRARDVAYIQGNAAATLGLPQDEVNQRMATLRQMDELIKNGMAGLCLKGGRPDTMGGPSGDFVHCKFLCDRWSGRTGHSVATSGRPVDKLNEELREIADSRAKPK